MIIVGGDDSNTNAAYLAEHLLSRGVKTRVVGVPKTIDNDCRILLTASGGRKTTTTTTTDEDEEDEGEDEEGEGEADDDDDYDDDDEVALHGVQLDFGFDTASRVYAEVVGNICKDAASSAKYWRGSGARTFFVYM